ncbi:MAG: hypothetical protein IT294_09595, partial [Deltaproteobacteria bacterium]|nr:hypothetical protein [Deltaproteobacteria bacterium]
MLSRRELIGKAAVGAAAALAVGGAGTAMAAARPRRDPVEGPASDRGGPASALERSAAPEAERPEAEGEAAVAPWEWLAPLSAGAVVGHGWSLGELTPVRDGSAVVTLRNARGH